jgi:hypothetical protein
MADVVAESDSRLTTIAGVGPVVAARLLGRTGSVSWFPSPAAFASYRERFGIRAKERFAVAQYIEIFDNRRRRHSHLGYRTPAEALTDYQARAAA